MRDTPVRFPTHFTVDILDGHSQRLQRLVGQAVADAALPLADVYQLKDWLQSVDTTHADSLGLLLIALFLALGEGSLCVELSADSLSRRLGDLLDAPSARSWAQQAIDDFHKGAFACLFGSSPSDYRPVIAWDGGERTYLYFQKYLKGELDFQQHFLRHHIEQPDEASVTRLVPILHEVLEQQPLRTDAGVLQLDADQQLALGLALSRHFVLISGGPGTGKTSIVLSLLRCLVRLGYKPERIALAAPTGRAAQRLADSIRAGLERIAPADHSPDAQLATIVPQTLHSQLGFNTSYHTFRRHQESPLQADAVIVDEVSMVGVVLMSHLFQALAPGTKLILLGDKDQLPSVDAGAVLGQLVQNIDEPAYSPMLLRRLRALFPSLEPKSGSGVSRLVDSIVYLRTNHRSQPAIRAAAEAVNRQDPTSLAQLPSFDPPAEWDARYWLQAEIEGGCRLWTPKTATVGEFHGMLEQWARHSFLHAPGDRASFLELVRRCEEMPEFDDEPSVIRLLAEIFERFDRARLLTLIREGPWGNDEINRHLEGWLRHRTDRYSRTGLFPGAPVLITRNDRSRDLNNGDVGLALRLGGSLRVVFARQGRFVSHAVEGLPSWEWGFALTVHKSQGSEYGQVLLVVPPRGGRRLLTKELVYTGITRAKRLALLCGARDALQHALQRKIVRESGLTWHV
jgi:exodeoxyribonuclease V alpha subunit